MRHRTSQAKRLDQRRNSPGSSRTLASRGRRLTSEERPMSQMRLGDLVSEFTPPAYEWLIDYRFPLKNVATLGGAAKSGKTQLVCCLAAAVTDSEIEFARGLRVNEPGNVLIFSTERTNDYFARIEVAGADISKVRIVNAERDYDFDRVIGQLQQVEPECNVRLVVLDHVGDLWGEGNAKRWEGGVSSTASLLSSAPALLILLVTHTVKTTNKAYRFQETFCGCAAWPRKVSDAWGMCLIKDDVGVIEHGIGTKKRFESCWEYHLAARVSPDRG